MEDGDGLKISSCSGMEKRSGTPADIEDNDSSKSTVVREPSYSSDNHPQSLKLFLGFNNINGDCADKDINQLDSSLVGSSSNNSLSSESSEVTQESSQDDAVKAETDSSSDNSSKSSFSDSPIKNSKEFSKTSDDLSPVNRVIPGLSESSDESDSSDSDESADGESNIDASNRPETPDSHSLLSGHIISEKEDEEGKSKNCLFSSESEISDKVECSKEKEKNNLFSPKENDVQPIQEESPLSDSMKPEKTDQAFLIPLESQEASNSKQTSEPDIPVKEIPEEVRNNAVTSVEKDKSDEIKEPSDAIKPQQILENSDAPIEIKQVEGSSTSDEIILPKNVSESKEQADDINSENICNIMESKSETCIVGENVSNQKVIVKDTPKTRQQVGDHTLRSDNSDKNLIKPPEKINKTSRRKTEERSTTSRDQFNQEKFLIQYKGFKNIGNNLKATSFKKPFLRWNPFNPCRKKDLKTGKYILQKSFRDDVDCSTLQPEYAQYLGLQPIVKFKCSNCGMSTFQSMSALNTHQIECKKNRKSITQVSDNIIVPDVNSANIKLTRKVFLCSTCGTYYENCDLFLHMREYHRRFICLFCLYMSQSPELLLEHLWEKHKVTEQEYLNLEEFLKRATQQFFLLCITCNKVFTEMDDCSGHKCSPKNSRESENNQFKRLRSDDSNITSSHESSCNLASDVSKTKTLKLSKDITMKPINNSMHSIDSCSLQNQSDSFNKSPTPAVTNDNQLALASENGFNNGASGHSESNPITHTESLQIKVPSGIEIKPLIPGENNHQETKFEPPNGPGIEIFPINTEPQMPVKKNKTLKTIKKRKPHLRTKIKMMNKGNPITPIPEETECLDESFVPPISPPIIAPPPIVADSESETPSGGKMANRDRELGESEPYENQSQLNREGKPQSDHEQKLEEEPSAHSSSVGDQSDSPIQFDSEEHLQNSLESRDTAETKRSLSQDIFKIKLKGDIESDGESDDSQKLSLIVDENTNNSEDSKKDNPPEGGLFSESNLINDESKNPQNHKNETNDVPLAREDVAAMALTLDDKIENVPIQAVVKECVRTSCLSCNYCRHAVKIAVNGKQLALHLLSEHRYTPVKNETNEDVIRKLKNSLDILQSMYFNTETYDSSDPSLHIPYDKESNFDCFQCSYVSSSHKDLYAHKRKCHTKSLLLCIMCKKNFFSYSELICHICAGTYNAESLVYSVDINFRCCFCRLDTIPSAFRLMVHLRKSHHTCDICLEMCTDQQKLSTHMWKHKLSHLCYRCNIAYASKPDITKHLFWKHGTESVLCKKCLQKKWPHVYHFCIPPTSFICEECNTSFSKAVALKVHKRIHGNDYPYSCPQCEKKFVSKKLLARHIDRHNAVFQKKDSPHNLSEDNKDEIINVTDITDNKESLQSDNNKDDGKDKSHKKHKKEKDKKEKKVVDVYDLPPLNLSSESDSSDEESSKKLTPKVLGDNNDQINCKDNASSEKSDLPKLGGLLEGDLYSDKSVEPNSFLNLLKPDYLQKDGSGDEADRKPTASEPVSPFDSSVVNSLLPLGKDEIKNDTTDSMQNEQVEGIWENFYKTNPQNSNLPFPLCAMKSDLAYRIIMGDHDYCSIKEDPVIKEDLPSTSNLETNFSGDKLEEVSPLIMEKPVTPPPTKNEENPTTPPSVSKKKVKSPKKKVSKTPDDNNSSSSSDSSSDSDSSCSCGTNCSCSSSSSSSSSSSDSDSSTNEDKKIDKRKKKKLPKSDCEPEPPKEVVPPEPEIVPLPEPEDPPIRESELETDESTSDEEFYDRQPQIIANQLLAEKRQMQLASVTLSNDSTTTAVAPPVQATPPSQPPPPPPPPIPQPQAQENIPPPDAVETPKPKPRTKRKRRVNTPKASKAEKPLLDSNFPKYASEVKPPPFSPLFPQTPPGSKQKPNLPVTQSPSRPEASGSGSETDSTRLSKRRRVPNKFYGYSSGDEEEKQIPKWRKTDTHFTTNQTPKMPPSIVPPPTPRIQLTVPKQVIRKPYHKQPSKPKIHSSTDSSESGTSDIDDRLSRPQVPAEPVKADKDVYCYCRCPYDEVSEMIACDDENCKIEWFHFECVGILVPPRGQWYCPGCRKARGLPT